VNENTLKTVPNNIKSNGCDYWSKSLCASDDYSTKKVSWRWPSQNIFGMWTVLNWTRS